MSKTVVILNPAAATVSAVSDLILQLAASHDFTVRILDETTILTGLVSDAETAGTSRIIVAGGDGTISRLVNELLPRHTHIELGIVPLGTGNDLARSLGIPLDNIANAFEIAATRPSSGIDVVHARNEVESYFINAATGGFGGEVTADMTATTKYMWGPFAYWVTAMGKLVDLHGFEILLKLDGEESQHRAIGIALANGRYAGGGFPIAGTALMNDGLLDVMLIPEIPTLELLAAGVNFMMDWNSEGSPLIIRRARRVQVRAMPPMSFSLDGEPFSVFDATFQVIPEAIRIVSGEKPALIPR